MQGSRSFCPHPSPTCPVKISPPCTGKQASSNGSLRPPTAGRCHVGRGRENNEQPTSLRNSLCGGLWVIASLDIICNSDPDVQLSGGTAQSKKYNSKQHQRKTFCLLKKIFAGKLRRHVEKKDERKYQRNWVQIKTGRRDQCRCV